MARRWRQYGQHPSGASLGKQQLRVVALIVTLLMPICCCVRLWYYGLPLLSFEASFFSRLLLFSRSGGWFGQSLFLKLRIPTRFAATRLCWIAWIYWHFAVHYFLLLVLGVLFSSWWCLCPFFFGLAFEFPNKLWKGSTLEQQRN